MSTKIQTHVFCTPYVKKQGRFNAQCSCNVNSELCIRQPLFSYIEGPEMLWGHQKLRLRIQAFVCFKLLFWGSRPPQTIGEILEISIAGRTYLYVSGKVVLRSKNFDIRILVRMFNLKLYNHIYCLSCQQREAPLRPRETTGDHGIPQRSFPAHKFRPVSQIQSYQSRQDP